MDEALGQRLITPDCYGCLGTGRNRISGKTPCAVCRWTQCDECDEPFDPVPEDATMCPGCIKTTRRDTMDTGKLRDRVDRLIAALEAADVRPLTITLNGVTPEQLVEAYPKATVETWISTSSRESGYIAIDDARVPGYPRIEASRHREPTAEELEKLEIQPYEKPGRHYFERATS
jgi:hypothetical protein